MKKVSLSFILGLVVLASMAQKKLNLSIRYDNSFDRYEVFVKPNFSQKNFTWGPSQISLVLPSAVLVDKIQIRNIDGGAWEDNSVVQAPEVSPDFSYHGILTSGDKTNLVEGHESVLFYFTLSKKVNPDLVRLFDNEKDPKSDSKGMMGGDFKNTIVDVSGRDWFNEVYTIEKNKSEVAFTEDKEPIDAIVYPNVITDNKFQVSLKGITDKEGDILMILADASGKEILRQRGRKAALEEKTYSLPKSNHVDGLVVKFITTKGSVSKILVAEN